MTTTRTMSDNELRINGFTLLSNTFGDVEAERFVMLMKREPFDYTEWRRENLFQGETVDSLMDAAEVRFGLHD